MRRATNGTSDAHHLKTAFIGGTRRGYLTLKALIEHNVEIVGIISLEQDAHETERYELPIRVLAREHKIPLCETKWMKDRDYAYVLRHEWDSDIALVVGCRVLIPSAVYEAPRKGSLGVHDSYLPEYRGFAPLNWSIINDEDHTGVSLFYLSSDTDGGDIVARKKIPFGKDETAIEVHQRVVAETIDLVLKSWPLLAQNKAKRVKQNYNRGSITCSRTPSDGYIDWNRSTRDIYNLIRALARPYSGAFTFLGGKKLTVWAAKPAPKGPMYVGRIPGRVVSASIKGGYIDVLTRDGILRITELQEQDGEPLPASQVVRSVRVSLGATISTLWHDLQKLR